ncbi:unnamed protein product [Callosobruchus maculatus]|uniref:MADF domain-containing protein n=1 Tax=Callosobruchus maculatus TaxID=64391 RepID=A0A653CMT9_CALMS|nr:unnamed protein product [Callosobruchus maculatus]
MAKKKWPAELTIKFLEGYESYPSLWDVHSASYKNKGSREEAYQKLKELMDIKGFGIADVKAKIRSIRNAYALEIMKMKKSQHSGAGADAVYKPKVAWFGVADRILRHVIQIRETQPSEIIEPHSETDYVENTQYAPVVEILSSSSNEISVARNPVPQRLTSQSPAPKRLRKRTNSTERTLQELQHIAEKLEDRRSAKDTEFDCFGRTVACLLKRLPENIALESMEYIHSYLIQKRLTSNAQQTTRPSPSASTSCKCGGIPNQNHSYHDSNTGHTNVQLNSQQEQSDIL